MSSKREEEINTKVKKQILIKLINLKSYLE